MFAENLFSLAANITPVENMSYTFQFFVTGDDLSKKLMRVIDGISKLLIKRFGSKCRSYTRDYTAYVLASSEAVLEPELGSRETLRIDTYFVLNIYQEELKARFDLPKFPAARMNGRTLSGEEALELASSLHSLLESSQNMSDRELARAIGRLAGGERAQVKPQEPQVSMRSSPTKAVEPAVKAVSKVTSRLTGALRSLAPPAITQTDAEKPAEPEIRPVPEESVKAPSLEGNVLRAGIMDCLAKLEKLRREGRVSEEEYRRMREIYLSLLE